MAKGAVLPASDLTADLLASSRRLERLSRPSTACVAPRPSFFYDRWTRTFQPSRCRRCIPCTRNQALGLTHAIALARPEWFVTLPALSDEPVRQTMQRIARALRREGPMEWAWHVERHAASNGSHVHAWLHSSSLAPSDIRTIASAALGGRITFVVRAEPLTKSYGFKEVLWADDRAALQYLAANGGTLLHTSRGFWRDVNGQRLRTRREAIVRARGRLPATGNERFQSVVRSNGPSRAICQSRR